MEADNRALAKELQARGEELILKNVLKFHLFYKLIFFKSELHHVKNVVADLKEQLGRLDTTSTVDFQELQKVIGEQKNVQILFIRF